MMERQSSPQGGPGAIVGEYRLERPLRRDGLGQLYTARGVTQAGDYLLRVLAVAARATDRAGYAARLERQAPQLMALQHPYILPLVRYGVQDGVPYLVWPQPALRTLGGRVTQSGPLDVVTTGRYLDQIAAALTYAHERGVLHRNLSADAIFLQPDGHLLVADFGVRRLLELLGGDTMSAGFVGSVEACAPEQVTGGTVDAATDVYALGGIVYRLLTGYPAFEAQSAQELVQRHLFTQPIPPSRRRPAVPAGLDAVLVRALAKDAEQRFRSAGEFANAYHEVVAPQSRMRVPFATSLPVGQAPDAPEADPLAASSARIATRSGPGAPAGPAANPPAGGGRPRDTGGPRATGGGRNSGGPRVTAVPLTRTAAARAAGRTSRNLARAGISAALLLVVLAGGLFIVRGLPSGGAAAGASGTVAFMDSPHGVPGHTDAVAVAVRGLAAAPSGSTYDVWLLSQGTEQSLALGTLTASGQSLGMVYDGNGSAAQAGANLLSLGNRVEVTREQGTVQKPVGPVVLSATFPPQAFVHIQHILLSYPTTPGKVGLLVGLLDQSQQLDTQATALQNAAAGGNATAVQCGLQSILDIIEGAHGAHYRALGPECAALNITLAGDGFGLLGPQAPAGGQGPAEPQGYIDVAADHTSFAATAPDATALIRTHAGHVEVALKNIKGWVTAADRDAIKLASAPGDAAALADLVRQCDAAYHGVSPNPDQPIQPVAGQAGAQTAYEHGQFMATLTLAPAH